MVWTCRLERWRPKQGHRPKFGDYRDLKRDMKYCRHCLAWVNKPVVPLCQIALAWHQWEGLNKSESSSSILMAFKSRSKHQSSFYVVCLVWLFVLFLFLFFPDLNKNSLIPFYLLYFFIIIIFLEIGNYNYKLFYCNLIS